MPMIILGLDPGLATTGYAIVEQSSRYRAMRAVEWGVIETKKQHSLPERLASISADLRELIARHRPHRAVVESLYFAKNAKTAMIVAQARGALLLTLTEHNIAIVELTPLQMKLSIASYGAAPKRQVQTMVKKLLGLPALPRPDDAADALALAVCGGTQRL